MTDVASEKNCRLELLMRNTAALGEGTLPDDKGRREGCASHLRWFDSVVALRPGIGNVGAYRPVSAGSSKGPKTNDRIRAAVPKDIYLPRAAHL